MKTQVLTVLVEDSDVYRDFLLGVLDDAPCFEFKTVSFKRLSEAVVFLRQHVVDLVLLDLSLPDSDGLQSVKDIKPVSGYAALVVITNHDDDLLERACIQTGAHQYIVKGKHSEAEKRRLIRNAVEVSWAERRFSRLHSMVEAERDKLTASEADPNLPPLPMCNESVAVKTDDTVVVKQSPVVLTKEP